MQVHRPGPEFVLRTPKGIVEGLPKDIRVRVKEEWSEDVSIPCDWVVPPCLQQVPYPLERTHREIYESADKVASRISDALRALSIETEYDNETAKAKCRTKDFVSFRIRLYAGGEDGQPVVVEVQRRSGPARCFMQSCRAILCAAEGGDFASVRPAKHPAEVCRVTDMKCLQGVIAQAKPEEDQAALDVSLTKAVELIRMQQVDSRRLGVEQLVALTDPIKTRPMLAKRVSKSIMLEDGRFNVREELMSVLERDVLTPDFEQTIDVSGISRTEHLRHLALNVLSSSLSLTSLDGSLQSAVVDNEWFGDFLIPTLMEEVRNAELYPNNAYEASCCLNTLMTCSDVARGAVERDDGRTAIRQAHAFGKRRHEALASETERCLKTLEALL
jgi:hypothetical protein